MLARVLGDVPAPIYYVAGPPAMVDTIQLMLAGAGVKSEDIRSDEFFGY